MSLSIVCFHTHENKTFVFMPRKHLCLLVSKPLAARRWNINPFMLSFLINFTLRSLQCHAQLHVPRHWHKIMITLGFQRALRRLLERHFFPSPVHWVTLPRGMFLTVHYDVYKMSMVPTVLNELQSRNGSLKVAIFTNLFVVLLNAYH